VKTGCLPVATGPLSKRSIQGDWVGGVDLFHN